VRREAACTPTSSAGVSTTTALICVQLVEELKATVSEETGRVIGEKYVSNLYGLYRTAVRDARVAELIPVDPCVLPRGMLRRTAKRGVRSPYQWADVVALASNGGAAGVFAALALFSGMREGEVCGRRWRDWERQSAPLGCLNVTSQYDDRPLKTERGQGEHAVGAMRMAQDRTTHPSRPDPAAITQTVYWIADNRKPATGH
jgi:hypothetical protein